MKVVARAVSQGSILPETTVSFRSGAVTVVPIESGQRPSVLGLILSGRMRPHSGEVTIDGEQNLRLLRKMTAVVDAPDVSAPEDDLTLAAVLREELAFSGGHRRSAAQVVNRMIANEGFVAQRNTRMAELPTDVRVKALAQAAAERKQIAALVIVTPDRHGGDPRAWYDVVRGLAARGLAVAVLAGFAAADAIAASFPDVVRDADGVLVDEVLVPGEQPEEQDEGALGGDTSVHQASDDAATALLDVQHGGAEASAFEDAEVLEGPTGQDPLAATKALDIDVAGEREGADEREDVDEHEDADEREDMDEREHADEREQSDGEQEHQLLRRDLRTRRDEEKDE